MRERLRAYAPLKKYANVAWTWGADWRFTSDGEARDRMAASTRALKVGDGMKGGVSMGPVISARHRERVRDYIDKGVKEGAELVVDGGRITAARRAVRRAAFDVPVRFEDRS